MPAVIEVKYFNSFILKKVLGPESTPGANDHTPVWNGSFGIPYSLGGYDQNKAETSNATITARNWAIEESRIRGGYNDAPTDLGARAYLDEEEPIVDIINNNTSILLKVSNFIMFHSNRIIVS